MLLAKLLLVGLAVLAWFAVATFLFAACLCFPFEETCSTLGIKL